MLTLLFFCLLGYLIGSTPTGKIVAKYKGMDIQAIGTKNIGASNMYLNIGKKLGFLVLIGDLGKAFIVIYISVQYLSLGEVMVVALFVLIGNIKSIFLNFTGGKGIATSLGIFLATEPIALLVLLALWLMALASKKFIFYSGIGALILVPYQFIYYGEMAVLSVFLMILFILIRHRENIKSVEQQCIGVLKR